VGDIDSVVAGEQKEGNRDVTLLASGPNGSVTKNAYSVGIQPRVLQENLHNLRQSVKAREVQRDYPVRFPLVWVGLVVLTLAEKIRRDFLEIRKK